MLIKELKDIQVGDLLRMTNIKGQFLLELVMVKKGEHLIETLVLFDKKQEKGQTFEKCVYYSDYDYEYEADQYAVSNNLDNINFEVMLSWDWTVERVE